MNNVPAFLAVEGLTRNIQISNDNVAILNKYPNNDYLSVVFSIALCWTAHAHNNDGFIDYAVEFFDSDKPISDDECKKHCMRAGYENLAISMYNLRKFKNKLVVPDFRNCSAKNLVKFQNRSYSILVTNKTNGSITNIGPWLFLGPLKIILSIEQRLWNDPDIDTLILPSGQEVIRGMRTLISNTHLIRSLTPIDLIEIEGDIYSGHARDCMINNELKNIAISGNSRVLHINTAIHMLGDETIILP